MVCVIPLLFGFFIPVGVLVSLVTTNDFIADFLSTQEIIVNTLIMASVAALVIMVLSFFIVVTATFRCGSKTRKLALFASTGYAFPGTIVAIGVLIFTGQLDWAISSLFGAQFQGVLVTSILMLFLPT